MVKRRINLSLEREPDNVSQLLHYSRNTDAVCLKNFWPETGTKLVAKIFTIHKVFLEAIYILFLHEKMDF